MAGITQSIDPSGMCLISISNPNGLLAPAGANLLFVDFEAVGNGDAGFVFDKSGMQLIAKDAQPVSIDVSPVRAMQKQ